MAEKPKLTSGFAQSELDKVEKQLDTFQENVDNLIADRSMSAPREEVEQQTKLSSKEIANSKEIYLKPIKRIGSREKFNEKFRASFDYDKEFVRVIAEHKELIGESIECWTKPYAGMPAENWIVPTNKPVWMPRYLAEQLKRKYYHRLVMKNTETGSDGMAQYYGSMAADTTIARLDCIKAPEKTTLFLGNRHF